MDSLLVTLVIVAIAALSNWLQRRAQGQENQEKTGPAKSPPPTPRPRRPATPPAAPSPTLESTLERELRRLLGEELPPVSPPPGRAAKPPVVQPPPVITPVPAPAARRATPPEPVPPTPQVTPIPARAQLGRAGSAYEQAQHLHESVALRLRQVDERTEKHGPGRMHPVAPVPPLARGSSLAALSHNPQAVRQAFIASLIFGEPKGL